MASMSSNFGTGPEDRETGSWANETLPMSVRKELLERELKKLGFRKPGSGGSMHASSAQQQQQPQGSSHPQAGSDPQGEHSE
jgi:hypothetical protein